jgi:transcriptional regulator with XRE-family HTH domain
MTTRQKLEIIQKMLGLTQTKLAERFDVSFTAFNSWWTGKSEPRRKLLNKSPGTIEGWFRKL